MSPSSSEKRIIASQTLFRGLDIVNAVADGCKTVQEISERTGITSSTTHRLASALVQIRYLHFEPRKGYRLGSKLLELGFLAYRGSNVTSCARAQLERLAAETSDTVHLATLDGDVVVYLDKIDGQRPIQVNSRIGGRKPICSTAVGKALILDAGEAGWRAHYEREAITETFVFPFDSWMAAMAQYAQGGYTFDLEENAPRICCVAAPVRDGTGKTVAAVSVTSTIDYTDAARMNALIPVLRSAAAAISRQLGGTN